MLFFPQNRKMKIFIKKTCFFFIICLAVFKADAQSVGGTTSGAVSDCDTTNGGFISVTGYVGTILDWESSVDGGASWSSTGTTISVQSYYNLTQTTCFRAIVKNGTAPSTVSTASCITIYSPTVSGSINGGGLFCDSTGSGSLTLAGNNGNVLYWEYSTDNGALWTKVPNTSTQLNYSNITKTTLYKAVVQNAPVCAVEPTAPVSFVVSPSVGGVVDGGGTFCSESGSGTLNLTGKTGNVLYWQYSTNGGASWTKVQNTTTQLNYPNTTQNTLYRAVVQNGSVCPADTSSSASFIMAPTVAGTVSISGSDTVCQGTNAGILNLTGNVGTDLKWISSTNNGQTWTELLNTTSSQAYTGLFQKTMYKVIVKNGSCSADTTPSVAIHIFPKSYVSAGNDTTIIPGHSAKLNGSGKGIPVWVPSAGLDNPDIFNPIAAPTVSTSYILTISDVHSCLNSDTLVIQVSLPEFNGIISNLFTPNGDGINDTWYIQDIQHYSENEVFVYNIYGKQVFTKKGYSNEWEGTYNGSELPDGTYYYVVRFGDSDKVIKGSLDLLKK